MPAPANRPVRSSILLSAMLAIAPAGAQAADASHPAVVELYQSQGCSSCPPAQAVLNQLADRPDILALSFAVTYWDQLGWKDVFGDPAYTRRQWEYARTGKRPRVYTPQVIVNGRGALVGNRLPAVIEAIRQNDRGTSGPALSAAAGAAQIGAGQGQGTLWLVRYDPRTQNVPIGAGENGGRTLPHRNIVRQLIPLGAWQGKAVQFKLPAPRTGLKSALLLQSGTGGPIIAARRI